MMNNAGLSCKSGRLFQISSNSNCVKVPIGIRVTFEESGSACGIFFWTAAKKIGPLATGGGEEGGRKRKKRGN